MKPWYIQFDPKIWLSDPCVRSCSPEAKGFWIDMLCFMFTNGNSGEITRTVIEFSRLSGIDTSQTENIINELKDRNVADVTFCNKNVTLINRKMKRDYEIKNNIKNRVHKYRLNKLETELKQECNADVTLHSNSNSNNKSNSNSKKHNNTIADNDKNYTFKTEYLSIEEKDHEEFKKSFPLLDVISEYQKASSWLMSNPANRKKNIKRFIFNWLSKAQSNFDFRSNKDKPYKPIKKYYQAQEHITNSEAPGILKDIIKNLSKDT